MPEPLKAYWDEKTLTMNAHYTAHIVVYGDCVGILLAKHKWDVEVRLWLADELVLHTYASDVAMGRRQVEAWLAANYPL